MSIYEQGLDAHAANYVPLSPVAFVERSAEVFGVRPAVVHGQRRYTWAQTRERTARLAAALRALGVKRLDTVSVMLGNTPEMIEAHYAVPAINAVLNTLNTRLDAALLAWQMHHCEARVLITDREFAPTVCAALDLLQRQWQQHITVIDVCDSEYTGTGECLGGLEYEQLLASHAPLAHLEGPANEWDAIAVSYTSGTTGDPKGVVTHHRGAYLNAVCNAVTWTLPQFAVYLWTLPMFHCNGWCFPWTVAMQGGTHVCLRRVEAQAIFTAMRSHQADHYCAAPIVHKLLIDAPAEWRVGLPPRVRGMVAAASPPAAMIEGMARMGFEITHVYGLTEVYGPASVAVQQPHWAQAPLAEQTRLHARQGVRYVLQQDMRVLDPDTMQAVAADGHSLGEVMFRGNIVMKGYLKNPQATQQAFAGGWFHTGDLAVTDPDHYVHLRDRSKDIIISGGENISSIEVEDALYRHPAVQVCAVVAQADARWGEVPVAFIELRSGQSVSAAELQAHCRDWLASFKIPKAFRFEDIPKTNTGKVQKFALRQRTGPSADDTPP
ncbi:MAG: acyl-CoA synthetase [Rhodoferax sp.]